MCFRVVNFFYFVGFRFIFYLYFFYVIFFSVNIIWSDLFFLVDRFILNYSFRDKEEDMLEVFLDVIKRYVVLMGLQLVIEYIVNFVVVYGTVIFEFIVGFIIIGEVGDVD